MAISINTTLNSQIEYWNGQKKSVSRNGLGMNPRVESGHTRQIQTGAIINPNNAPPKIWNLFSKIFLWSLMWKEGRTLQQTTTNKNIRYSQFYKNQSLKKIRARIRSLKWIIQIGYTNCVSALENHRERWLTS